MEEEEESKQEEDPEENLKEEEDPEEDPEEEEHFEGSNSFENLGSSGDSDEPNYLQDPKDYKP